jgi:cytochrome c oxidase cbb3-type subunit 3
LTVSVVLPGGEHLEGRLLHVDDFLVSLRLADGTERSFPRHGAEPKVDVHDPMKIHHDLLTEYNDRDIHDVTAFLATLK